LDRLYNKILCPIDFSEFSAKALQKAAALAALFDAKLVLAHVITNPWSDQYFTVDDKHVSPDDVIGLAKQKIANFVDKHHPALEFEIAVTIHEHSYRGIIEFASLVEYATIEQVDLIVLSTHGYTGSMKLFLGSVAEAVVRQAQCSVLVVR
jgi:nucleotide-binding universal stress UspA family protein